MKTRLKTYDNRNVDRRLKSIFYDYQPSLIASLFLLFFADILIKNRREVPFFIGTTVFNCPQGNYIFVCQRKIISSPNPAFRRVEITVYASNPESTQTASGPRLAWLTTVIPNPASGVM